jgi:Tfp pilus assembly protein PilW
MNTYPLLRLRGFSLVELMVSVVIGMLALMFATRLITGAEQNKQSALGGSDSMQNRMLALFSISGDAAQAGFGLNDIDAGPSAAGRCGATPTMTSAWTSGETISSAPRRRWRDRAGSIFIPLV